MNTAPAEAVPRAAFPRHYGLADTGPRFALLMTVVTASSVDMLNDVLAPIPNDTPGDALGCLLASGMDPDGRNLDNLLSTMRRPEALQECMSGVPTLEYWKGMVGTAVLLVIAALVYWWTPRLRERWRRTVPVETLDADGTLVVALHELRGLAGVASGVRFRVDPTRTTAGAVVYGRFGQYTVCLHAGLLVRRVRDPEGFRAVVLHELAHVRNRDVDYASASTALWRVFVALALLPYLWYSCGLLLDGVTGRKDSPFWPGLASAISYQVLTGLLLVGLVHLARADLLRHRELHADARAVSSGAQPSAWTYQDREGAVAGPIRRVTALVRTHPSWAERRRMLAQPARLSGVGALAMLLIGVSGTLLVNMLGNVVPQLGTATGGAWFTTVFITPVLWVSLTRSVAAAQVSGRAQTGIRAGVWLGCGLVLGELASGNNGTAWLRPGPVFLLGLFLPAVAVAAWSAQCTRLALAVAPKWPRRAAGLFNLLVSAVVLWGGMYWWYGTGYYQSMGVYSQSAEFRAQMMGSSSGSWQPYAHDLAAITRTMPTVSALNASLMLQCAALLLWLLPLSLRAAAASASGLRLGRTIAAGVAGGLGGWAVLLVVLRFQHERRPASVAGRLGPYAVVHGWMLIAGVIAACLLTATVVAAVSRHLWMPRALLATAVAQLLGHVATFALTSADGCLGPFSALGDQCHWVPKAGWVVMTLTAQFALTTGMLLAACAAVVGAGVGWAVRGMLRRQAEQHPGSPLTPTPSSRWRHLAPASAAFALAVPMLLLVTAAHIPMGGTKTSSAVRAGTSGASDDTVTELLDGAPEARTARIRSAQAAAWLAHGGLDHYEAIGKSIRELGDALVAAGKQKPGANGQVKLDGDMFARVCGTLTKRADAALAYFPVPDESNQKTWSKSLAELSRTSRVCVAALTPGGDTYKTQTDREKAFWTALDELMRAERALPPVMDDIKKAAQSAIDRGDI
jgi:Zn-dependent protease with chaperone function